MPRLDPQHLMVNRNFDLNQLGILLAAQTRQTTAVGGDRRELFWRWHSDHSPDSPHEQHLCRISTLNNPMKWSLLITPPRKSLRQAPSLGIERFFCPPFHRIATHRRPSPS